jgi:hypothetical protein
LVVESRTENNSSIDSEGFIEKCAKDAAAVFPNKAIMKMVFVLNAG